MNIQTEQIILISISTAFLIAVLLLYRYCFKKFQSFRDRQIISEKEFKLIKYLFYLYIGLELPSILIEFLEFNRPFYVVQRIFSLPLYFVINIIPVYIAGILFFRKYVNPFNKIEPSGTVEQLNDSVKKIFNSTDFYNAISTVLPKGEKDGDYGLDYIPFMLQNLQDKRKRFQKSSTNFLITTICLSIFFVMITIFFSYVLLNESSIGIYSEVKNLTGEVENINRTISSLRVDITSDKYFMQTNAYALDKLQSPYKFDLPDNQSRFAYDVKESIDAFNKSGNLGKLVVDLKFAEDTLTKSKTEKTEKYLDALTSTNKSLVDYLNFKDKSFRELEITQSNIKVILPKIQEELNKPANSQNELIKRMILSIVVITFFLAILRYFRSLYQSHYSEMIKAEQQDLIIRKFYVTLKSSEGNSEERKLVLSNFLSDVGSLSDSDNNQNLRNKSHKIENDVLRDIVNAILKKI
jgi:hypothetical protein